jgi:hypothetical protein
MSLIGKPPAPLLSLVREISLRMTDEPREVRENLGFWLQKAANWKLENRWPYIYSFFMTAQLPPFRLYLHLAREVALPAWMDEALRPDWERLPLDLVPPLVIPEGASPEEEATLIFLHRLDLMQAVHKLTEGDDRPVSVEILASLWEAAYDMKVELEKLLARIDELEKEEQEKARAP